MMHWFFYFSTGIWMIAITHAIIFMFASAYLRKTGFYLQMRMLRKYNQMVTENIPWYVRYTDWVTRSKPMEPFESEVLDMIEPIIKQEEGDKTKWQ